MVAIVASITSNNLRGTGFDTTMAVRDRWSCNLHDLFSTIIERLNLTLASHPISGLGWSAKMYLCVNEIFPNLTVMSRVP